MDNYFENDYYIETMSLRLQSKRKKIRSIKEGYSKSLIQLDKERNRLWKARNKKVYIDLDPPYQSGWKRLFVLRADISQGSYASFFNLILERINTVQYSDLRDFKVKKRKLGRKIRVNRNQELKKLYEQQWQSGFSDREKQMFYEVQQMTTKGKLEKFYLFAEPWRFVLRVRPNMITKALSVDAELESDLKRLENYVDKNFLQFKIDKAKSEAYRNGRFTPKQGHRRHYKKTVCQYMDAIKDEWLTDKRC